MRNKDGGPRISTHWSWRNLSLVVKSSIPNCRWNSSNLCSNGWLKRAAQPNNSSDLHQKPSWFLLISYFCFQIVRNFAKSRWRSTLAWSICCLWRPTSLSIDLNCPSNSGLSSRNVSTNSMSQIPSRLTSMLMVQVLEKGSGHCPSPGVKRGREELR